MSPEYIKFRGLIYTKMDNLAVRQQPRLGVSVSEIRKNKIKTLNKEQVSITDRLLRSIGQTWHTIDEQLKKERGGDPHIPLEKLMITVTPEVIMNLKILADMTKTVENYGSSLAAKAEKLNAAPEEKQEEKTASLRTTVVWDHGIPAIMIRYKGNVYRYAAGGGWDEPPEQQEAKMGEEARMLIFNSNRNQFLFISNLLDKLVNAWHEIHNEVVPLLPEGEPSSEKVSIILTKKAVQSVGKLAQALSAAVKIAEHWHNKYPALQKRINQDIVNVHTDTSSKKTEDYWQR